MLTSGSSGDDVRKLQEGLAKLGFDPGPVDGIFGAKTAAAVKAFQESVKSLDVDGIAGPKTAAKLEAKIAKKAAKKEAKEAKKAAKKAAGAAKETDVAASLEAMGDVVAKAPEKAAEKLPRQFE